MAPFGSPVLANKVADSSLTDGSCSVEGHKMTVSTTRMACRECAAIFFPRAAEVARGKGRFCSARCANIARNGPRRVCESRAATEARKRADPLWPIKLKARHAISRAIEAGRLMRQPCGYCGAENSDAHHSDYNRPLDVIWLCRSCHLKEHRS